MRVPWLVVGLTLGVVLGRGTAPSVSLVTGETLDPRGIPQTLQTRYQKPLNPKPLNPRTQKPQNPKTLDLKP